MSVRGLGDQLPIYTTRKDAQGIIGTYTLSGWMILLVMFLVWANIVGWGAYGLVTLVSLAV